MALAVSYFRKKTNNDFNQLMLKDDLKNLSNLKTSLADVFGSLTVNLIFDSLNILVSKSPNAPVFPILLEERIQGFTNEID